MTRPAILKLLRWAGTGLAAVLTIWFVAQLLMSDIGSAREALTPALIAITGALAILYAGLGAALAFGWSRLIHVFGGSPEGQMRLHAVTQVMKYLPGNVFHLAGRHGMARRKALSHQTLLLAALAETGLLVLAALLVGLLAVRMLPMPEPALVAGLAAACLAGAALMIGLIVWQWRHVGPPLQRVWRARWALALLLPVYLGFFAVYGAIGGLLLSVLSPAVTTSLLPLTAGAFALAWLAGFLTPGAPAGIGVRESVLLLILTPFAGAGPVLLLAALARVVTILGDTFLAAAASLMAGLTPSTTTSAETDWETSLGRS